MIDANEKMAAGAPHENQDDDGRRGKCASSSAVCGTTWTGLTSTDDTCPTDGTTLPTGYKSWKNIMENKNGEVALAKDVAKSDTRWFQRLMEDELFDAGTSNFAAKFRSCATKDVAEADFLVAELRVIGSLDEGTNSIVGRVTVTASGSDFTLTLSGARPA